MTQSRAQTGHSRKLLAGRAIKIRIALASGVALSVGAWLAPRAVPTNLSAPQEHAAPLLDEQVQLREASHPFIGVQDVATAFPQKMAECVWLKPVPVGQFEFLEWTADNHLRHSKFIGLREDKNPREVVRE